MKNTTTENFKHGIAKPMLCDSFLIPMTDFVIVKSLGENYFINRKGQLYSEPRMGSKGGILKEQNGEFYKFYRVSVKGKTKNVLTHRLLGECFIPNPENKPQINHIDGNKHNNSLDNLEWCTNQENIKHSIETGLKDLSFNKGENNSRSILDNQKVREIKNKLKSGFRNIDLATKYNVSQQLICDIKKYRRWKDIT